MSNIKTITHSLPYINIYYTINWGYQTEVELEIKDITKNPVERRLYKYELDTGLWLSIKNRNTYWGKNKGLKYKLAILSELKPYIKK